MALTDNIVSYWKLNESSGNASDSVGSNTLTNNNTVTYVPAKIANGANLVRASSQYLSIADASQTGLDLSSNFTFTMWVNLATHPINGEYMGLINKWVTAGQRAYEMYYFQELGTPQFGFDTSSDGTNNTGFTLNNTLSVSTYYFLAFTKSSTTGTIYVNASSIGTGTVASTIANGTDRFGVGITASADFFNGILDEISAFLQGTVAVTGAAGLVASIVA
jgi:hypothetical protein